MFSNIFLHQIHVLQEIVGNHPFQLVQDKGFGRFHPSGKLFVPLICLRKMFFI